MCDNHRWFHFSFSRFFSAKIFFVCRSENGFFRPASELWKTANILPVLRKSFFVTQVRFSGVFMPHFSKDVSAGINNVTCARWIFLARLSVHSHLARHFKAEKRLRILHVLIKLIFYKKLYVYCWYLLCINTAYRGVHATVSYMKCTNIIISMR